MHVDAVNGRVCSNIMKIQVPLHVHASQVTMLLADELLQNGITKPQSTEWIAAVFFLWYL